MITCIWSSVLASIIPLSSVNANRLASPGVALKRGLNSSRTSNTTLWEPSLLNGTALHDGLEIACDGSIYDWDLSEASCIDAYVQISRNRRPAIFGYRDLGDWDVQLPQRVLGGTVCPNELVEISLTRLEDGLCAITITTDHLMADQSSARELRDVAEELIHTCVSGAGRTQGGIATGIGIHTVHRVT